MRGMPIRGGLAEMNDTNERHTHGHPHGTLTHTHGQGHAQGHTNTIAEKHTHTLARTNEIKSQKLGARKNAR